MGHGKGGGLKSKTSEVMAERTEEEMGWSVDNVGNGGEKELAKEQWWWSNKGGGEVAKMNRKAFGSII